ncbi:MAG TPA: NUDIX domain-containing protein, partial [Ramlibacter sp.]
ASWTLPKGEIDEGEDPLAAACREFSEETGFVATPPFLPLGELRQKSGKRISAWAFEGDADPAQLRSNLFEMEWPPRSGRFKEFPEVDRLQWYDLETAAVKLIAGQVPFLAALQQRLGQSAPG